MNIETNVGGSERSLATSVVPGSAARSLTANVTFKKGTMVTYVNEPHLPSGPAYLSADEANSIFLTSDEAGEIYLTV